jgi:hypothetical protein
VEKPAERTAVETLMAFFAALCAWEREALRQAREAERAGEALDVDSLRQGREAILAEFCTNRRRVYSSVVSYGPSPEYNPDEEEILEVKEESDRRVVVLTRQRSRLGHRRRFVLLRGPKGWRVDRKQCFEDRKWQRDHL